MLSRAPSKSIQEVDDTASPELRCLKNLDHKGKRKRLGVCYRLRNFLPKMLHQKFWENPMTLLLT
jgi:hypothetical protein